MDFKIFATETYMLSVSCRSGNSCAGSVDWGAAARKGACFRFYSVGKYLCSNCDILKKLAAKKVLDGAMGAAAWWSTGPPPPWAESINNVIEVKFALISFGHRL